MNNIGLKIFNGILVFITAILTFMCGVFIYYKTLGKDKIPSAVTSTYASFVTDPQTGEEKPVIEVNYYSNYNKTGYEVTELLFNCYSGVSKQAIYARGFQLVKDKDGKIVPYVYDEQTADNKTENFWRYDKNSGNSFLTGNDYSWGDPMIIDINGETYAVKLDGKYTKHHKYFNLGGTIWNGIKNTFTLHWGRDAAAYDEWDEEFEYTFQDLLVKVGKIVTSYSNGTGNSVIPLVDLGDFLHIYQIKDGKIAGKPIGQGDKDANNTLINSYFTISAHYDLRGMVWAEQSMFKSVAGDTAFNISGIDTDVDYWKAKSQLNLTEQDFEKRYVSTENGFYYYLTSAKMSELKNFENAEININFDLSKLGNVNCLGFDYYALYGIKVKSLSISSTTAREFNLLAGSLKETGLTSITTNNITIHNINSGVEL